MLGNAHAYSAAVCANVAAEARKRLEEGDLDNIIRTRFFEVEMNAAFVDLPTPPPLPPATPVTGSRMIRQLGDVVRLTGKGEPFEAMASLLRELRELREFKKAILASTEKASSEAAIASVRQAMGERNVLKEAETGLGASLGSDGSSTSASLLLAPPAPTDASEPVVLLATILVGRLRIAASMIRSLRMSFSACSAARASSRRLFQKAMHTDIPVQMNMPATMPMAVPITPQIQLGNIASKKRGGSARL
mgnify:CR=1 FL=1|jgi:hypothetical protein